MSFEKTPSRASACATPLPRPLPRLPRAPEAASPSLTPCPFTSEAACTCRDEPRLWGPLLSRQTSWVRRAARLPGGHLGLWRHGPLLTTRPLCARWLLSPELGAAVAPRDRQLCPRLRPPRLRAVQTLEPSPARGQPLDRPCGRSLWPRGPVSLWRDERRLTAPPPRFLLPLGLAPHVSGHVRLSAPGPGPWGICDTLPGCDLRPLPQVARGFLVTPFSDLTKS